MPSNEGELTRRGRDHGEQDPSDGLGDRDRDKATQHKLVLSTQCIYPEDLAVGKLVQELMSMSHLSIRNIWAKSVDHMKKTGCRMAERLQLRARSVQWIQNF